ncbi:hypothetical protein PAAG_04107 [Paracoccidioides lutzii Pb01]|uniref:Uncharacterized protein n=1 Tax=Paracoccidioides lutzii (strain ATCC MYA-826 / Pb01) TaxID=502779 RepID=C1H013_PARBA|nr:hypothetical protein PAAG_04107 [Paracoccidioides lutzii Pb01]EEH33054.2 hypothetical protein PAAG_04107 [Paracoccidioides lutzii Pb01]
MGKLNYHRIATKAKAMIYDVTTIADNGFSKEGVSVREYITLKVSNIRLRVGCSKKLGSTEHEEQDL